MRRIAPILCLSILALRATAANAEDKDFKPIFNGKDFSGLKFEIKGEPASTWSVRDGVIVCTGKPNGYFYTEKSYRNYVLQAEVKYPKGPGNSGFLLHVHKPHKVFPKCVEVQGHYGSLGMIFPLGSKGPRKDGAAARKAAIKPAAEWNQIEIISKDGIVTSFINGKKIAEAGPYELKEGPIGFQSEGKEIHFRNLRIKELGE